MGISGTTANPYIVPYTGANLLNGITGDFVNKTGKITFLNSGTYSVSATMSLYSSTQNGAGTQGIAYYLTGWFTKNGTGLSGSIYNNSASTTIVDVLFSSSLNINPTLLTVNANDSIYLNLVANTPPNGGNTGTIYLQNATGTISGTTGIPNSPAVTVNIQQVAYNGPQGASNPSATQLLIAGTTANQNFYPTFVGYTGSTGYFTAYVDGASGLYYNPSTGIINSNGAAFVNPPTCSIGPTAANQLGNKTYIDNFGGTGGWYFTSSVSITAATSLTFSDCLNNAYNAYEIYIIPSISSPISGYLSIQLTMVGFSVPVYQTWSSVLGNAASPTYINSYNTTAPFIQGSMDASVFTNRTNPLKIDFWGTRNISGGPGSGRMTYLCEGFTQANPGVTGWNRSMGTIAYTSGIATGITLTFSLAVTGTYTIYVKSKY